MSLLSFFKKIQKNKIPSYVSFIITDKCNFKCQSCSIWKKQSSNCWSYKNTQKLADKIIEYYPPHTHIEINGGEPLIVGEKIIPIIKKLALHFTYISMNTNGLLINKTIIKKLETAGLKTIKISLYSLNKNTHNLLRGNSQAFSGAIKGIKLIHNSNINLEVGILITKKNIDEVVSLVKYLSKFPKAKIYLQILDEKISSDESINLDIIKLPLNLWPSRKQIIKFFRWIQKHNYLVSNQAEQLKLMETYYLNPKLSLKNHCQVYRNNSIINVNGDISYCFKRPAFGNINNKSIKDLFDSPLEKAEKYHIYNCKKYCRVLGCNRRFIG